MNYNLIISTICKFQVPKTKFMKILNTLYGIMICAIVPLRFMQQINAINNITMSSCIKTEVSIFKKSILCVMYAS